MSRRVVDIDERMSTRDLVYRMLRRVTNENGEIDDAKLAAEQKRLKGRLLRSSQLADRFGPKNTG